MLLEELILFERRMQESRISFDQDMRQKWIDVMKEREGTKKSKKKGASRQISSAMGNMTESSILEMLRAEEVEKEDKMKKKAEGLENRNKRKAEREIKQQESQETKKAAKEAKDAAKDEANRKKDEATKKKKEEADKKKEEKSMEQATKKAQKKSEKELRNTQKPQDPIKKCKECSNVFESVDPDSIFWRSCENCPNWFCKNCCSVDLEKCKYC